MGRHLIASFYNCQHEDILTDPQRLLKLMWMAAVKANATPLESEYHYFDNGGVSVMIIVAESHLSIHTWPEYNYAEVDIYTCGDTIPEAALHYLKDAIDPDFIDVITFNRGNVRIIENLRR